MRSRLQLYDKKCISYYSYIKPQLQDKMLTSQRVVYRTIPTSNHNSALSLLMYAAVVYRTIPTSNHNFGGISFKECPVVYRTIPTSNHNSSLIHPKNSGVVYRTIPTSNHNCACAALRMSGLYIVLFLHQTTTVCYLLSLKTSCISYYSYIKPQLRAYEEVYRDVVYRTIPTSNHNAAPLSKQRARLYIVLFLHQTTTLRQKEISVRSCISYYSYIKPQLLRFSVLSCLSCISYYSYIKPQLGS